MRVIHVLSQLQNILEEQSLSVQNTLYVDCSLVVCDFLNSQLHRLQRKGCRAGHFPICSIFFLYITILLELSKLRFASVHVSASASERCTVSSLYSLLM
mmetsp:Transcript_11438/g.70262  ORF Transcript_11438/g.70262 Transcript_11438/m.70262 type:complete len:99 (+) Transcript_11438:236-532(+)